MCSWTNLSRSHALRVTREAARGNEEILVGASSQAPAWEFSTGSSCFPARKARALLTGFPSGSLGTSVKGDFGSGGSALIKKLHHEDTKSTKFYIFFFVSFVSSW